MLKLVSPCCGKPLDINHIDEVAVVEYPPLEDGEAPYYALNCYCCYDHQGSTLAFTPKDIERAKNAVCKASIQKAKEQLQQKHDMEMECFWNTVEEFRNFEDPEMDRHYVSANWGSEPGRFVANHRTCTDETKEEAEATLELKAQHLIAEGYTEATVLDLKDGNAELWLVRKFIKGESIRLIGYWSMATGYGGSGSSGCEASYLSCS